MGLLSRGWPLVAACLGLALLVPTAGHAATSRGLYATSSLYPGGTGTFLTQFSMSVSTGGLTAQTPATVASGNQPRILTMTPDGKHLYAPNNVSATISQYDVGAGGALTAMSPATVAASSNVLGIVVSADGKNAYVAGYSTNTIRMYAIDQSTGALSALSTPTIAASAPHKLVITKDGRFVYVSSYNSNAVLMFNRDTTTGLLTAHSPASIGASSQPVGIALTPDNTSLYTGSNNGTTVNQYTVNTSTGTLTAKSPATVSLGTQSRNLTVSPDGKHLYVAELNASAVANFDIASGTGLLTAQTPATIAAGSGPRVPVVSPDGKRLFVSAFTANAISQYSLNASTGVPSAQSPATVTSAGGPWGLAIVPNQGPTAAFSAAGSRYGQASTFDASASSDSDGSIAKYDWDWGDGNTSANGGATPSHTYAKPGSYSVTLTVTDDEGCSSSYISAGQTAYCNGGSAAVTTRTVKVAGTGRYVYVANQGAGTISWSSLDLATRVTTAGFPATFATGGSPRQVVVAPDGKHAYVPAAGGGAVYQYSIDQTTGALVAMSPASVPAASAFGAVASPDGTHLYVTGGGNQLAAFDIDPSTGALTAQSPATVAAGNGPEFPAVSHNAKWLYVPNWSSSTISMYTLSQTTGAPTPMATPTVSTGGGPVQITVSQDDRFAYVAGSAGAVQVMAIDPSTGVLSQASSTSVANTPVHGALSPDGAQLYVAGLGGSAVSVFDVNASTGALTAHSPASFVIGSNPYGVALSPDGKSLFGSTSAPALATFDIAAGAATAGSPATLTTGATPWLVTVSPDQGPAASFTKSIATSGSVSAFDASGSSDPDGSVARYDWDFGDGTVLANGGATPSHTYGTSGTFAAKLTVTDNEGCSATATSSGHSTYCNPSATGGTASQSVTVAVTPPTITSPPADPSSANASVSFTGIAGQSLACQLDSGSWTACTSPASLAGLSDGSHTFRVRATDAGGTSPAVSVTWTADATAPTAPTIGAGPTEGQQVGSTSASFSFASTDPGGSGVASYECRTDGGTWVPCTSPNGLTAFTDGAHTFSVRATDSVGNTGAATSRAWTVDTTAPGATISSGPTDPTNATTATIAFGSADTTATFECRLDGGSWASCASPQVLSSLSEASHTFQVRATDPAGNTGAADLVAWTVDTTPPTLPSITAGPPEGSQTSSVDATITFSGSTDVGGSGVARYECRLDGASYATCASPAVYSSLGEGTHQFRARAVDQAGNPSVVLVRSWTIDTTAPVATISSAPSGTVATASATPAFTSTDNSVTFECRLDAGAWAPCTTPRSLTGLADGSHTFLVRATDPAGNTGAADSATWTVDTTAPTVTIDSEPAGLTNVAAATFAFSSGDPTATFECKPDSDAWQACTSPASYSALGEGSHTFRVRPTDPAGNVGATEVSTWTVDTIAPDTTITSGPSSLTASNAATVAFGSTDAGATFACRLDGGAYAACSSPKSFTALTDGAHTVRVRATDAAGNTGAADLISWTVDTTAPGVSITPPPALTARSTETIAFTSADTTATFACDLDGGGYTACTSPKTLTGLGDGSHTFRVRATDPAGNTSTPDNVAWTVDTTAPSATITSAPASLSASATATLAFASADPAATFECRLDGSSWMACASPATYSALSDAAHSVDVRAIDLAGNIGAADTASWTIDTTPPGATITVAPPSLTATATATLDFTSTDPGATFACRLDSGSWMPCASPATLTSLGDGSHAFHVRATDPAGNTGAEDTASWTVDTTAPDAAITAGPVGSTASTTATVSFTAQDAAATFECKLDAGTWSSCTSPHTETGLGDGTHTIRVRATDLAGNVGVPDSITWTIDTSAPGASITSAPVGTTAAVAASIAFDATDAGSTFECNLDGTAWAACTSPVALSNLAEGSHTFAVRATNTLGTTSAPVAASWTVDTTAPVVTITAAPAPLVAAASASISFSSTDVSASLQCNLDAAGWAPCSSPLGLASLADGVHVLRVRGIDPAGNVGSPDTASWRVDTSPPTASIDSAPLPLTSSPDASFSFSTDDPAASMQCRIDTGVWSPCTSPQTFTGLADGSHVMRVRGVDVAGNVGSPTTFSWTIDSTPPVSTINSGPAGIVRVTNASFTFTSSDVESSFECRLDTGSWLPCTSPRSANALNDGAHTFAVRATDLAGNTGAADTWRWTVDTLAPSVVFRSVPSNLTASSAASLTFDSPDASATFECRTDGGSWSACASPTSLSSLPDGTHTVDVRAIDAAGNTGAVNTAAWTVDMAAPPVTIDGGPAGTVRTGAATIPFSSDDASATFGCRLDGGSWGACSSPQTWSGLPDGSHVFEVRATDPAGNTGAADVRSWTVDTIAPAAQFTSGPATRTASTDATFAFTTADPSATLECQFDTGPWSTCASPEHLTALTDASHTARVRATDAAGNVGVADVYTWTVDTTGPDVRVGVAPAGVVATDLASIAFSSVESGVTFACRLDGGSWTACTSPFTAAALAEGAHTAAVRAIDDLGNIGASDSASWTVDTTAPTTSITRGPPALSASSSTTVDFVADDPSAAFTCQRDGGAWTACTSPWSATGLADGSHTFLARATDAVGNVGAADSMTWTVDTAAPAAAFSAGPPALTNATTAHLTFASPDLAASLECALDGGAWQPCTSPRDLTGLREGDHTARIRATDAAGNTGAADRRDWTVDTTAPGTTLHGAPSGLTRATGASIGFTSADGSASFECQLDGGSWNACVPPVALSALPDGAHTFKARATDPAGNTGGSDSAAWIVDTTAPSALISSGPVGTVASASATLRFASSDAGATFACSLDGGPWTACTSPHDVTGLGDGAHTVQVRAADAAGNVGPADGLTWTVDTTAPGATITNAPVGTVASDRARLEFASADSGATFECQLDAAAWAACSSPDSLSGLADGAHTFRTRAVDPQGNTSLPASASWTVDTVAPAVTITSMPASLVRVASASLAFASSDPAAVFACHLDSAAWSPCSSPGSLTGLGDGSHTFHVRASDPVGNVGGEQTATWTVDTTAPVDRITSAPAALTRATTATVGFTSDDPASASECRLDVAAWSACLSPVALTGLADGAHTLSVRSFDAAGNVGAAVSATWQVDATAPTASISGGPAPLTRATSAAFVYDADTAATFECQLDAGAWAPCASPVSLSGLADGAHTFGVRPTDAAGNTGAATSRTWTIDTAAPSTTLSRAPAAITNDTTADLAFTSPDVGATFTCRFDLAGWGPCTSPTSASGLAEGGHTFEVRATDAAGNIGAQATAAWQVDATPPAVRIDTRPPSTSSATSATLAFSSADLSAAFACEFDGAPWAPCSSPTTLRGLLDGPHTLRVRATDLAGNTGVVAAAAWTVDTGAPTTTIDRPPLALAASASASVSFHADDPSAVFECRTDDGAWTSCTSPLSLQGLADGPHGVSVRAVDTPGNVGPSVDAAWVVDTVAPQVTITGHPRTVTTDRTAVFTFTSPDPGARFECRTDDADWERCLSPQGVTGLSDGDHQLQARAIDAAGNLGGTSAFSWRVDRHAPDTVIERAPSGYAADRHAVFTFSSVDQTATFECRLDADEWTPCASPLAADLPDGIHVFAVRAIGDNELVDPTPPLRSFVVDTVSPNTQIEGAPIGMTLDNGLAATFASNEPGARFTCALDGAPMAECAAGLSRMGLTVGTHTLTARAIDRAGNVDPAPAVRSWSIGNGLALAAVQPRQPARSGTRMRCNTAGLPGGTTQSYAWSRDGVPIPGAASATYLAGPADNTHQLTCSVRVTFASGGVATLQAKPVVVLGNHTLSDVGFSPTLASRTRKPGAAVLSFRLNRSSEVLVRLWCRKSTNSCPSWALATPTAADRLAMRAGFVPIRIRLLDRLIIHGHRGFNRVDLTRIMPTTLAAGSYKLSARLHRPIRRHHGAVSALLEAPFKVTPSPSRSQPDGPETPVDRG